MTNFSRKYCDSCEREILHNEEYYTDGLDTICDDCKDEHLFVLNDGNYKLVSPGNENPTYIKEV